MNKTVNAVVILYNGAPFTAQHQALAGAIVEAFMQAGLINDSTDVVIKAKDADDICKALLKEHIEAEQPANVISILANNQKKEDHDLLAGAIVLIGTTFAESLIVGKRTRNYAPFMRDLLLSHNDAKIRRAIEVIATSHASVNKKLYEQYRLTPGAVETIRDANGTLQLPMCHGEHKQKFSAKPQNSTHKNAIPYKRKQKYREDYQNED